ncbi:chloride channel protein [Saccharomonospora sp. NB11]|jgi:H+/Cl- antiporter ClcA|uniref:chloride channel protein n=1 Tax=Saccharomonospora sp. NB11 TaxID=1642298 RepID=UPI001E5E1719|nr:chloride channel protein [Saccharomonospora sp. NB11]
MSTPRTAGQLLRSRGYLAALAVSGLLGVPVALLAYGFLQLASYAQRWVFEELPSALGLGSEPVWWPVPMVTVGGLVVGLVVRHLPGDGGESGVDGVRAGGPPAARHLPGIALAALGTLAFGAVLGPEAPLIALGGGLAALAVRALRRDAPEQAVALIGAAGSFAAISTLLGSPLLGAFLLLEVAGAAGTAAGRTSVLLVPGLLASGLGALIFLGLDSVTGLAKPSLVVPDLPPVRELTLAQFGWAIVIGVAAALLGTALRRLARPVARWTRHHVVVATAVAGLKVGLLACLYALLTSKGTRDVLFSGQEALGPLLAHGAEYSAGSLLLLLGCKGLAYGVSLGAFRGGPVFPAMFLGAVGGLALSHLPGLDAVPAAAMGIGALCVTMLGLPLVSVLLATLLLLSSGLATMPLVIVSVVVAYVLRAWLSPATDDPAADTPRP